MKGIIMAAGTGSRLYPATFPVSKVLLPVYDRPLLYCPLSALMLAGVREILVISNELDSENFRRTLGDGSQFGLEVSYAVQGEQRGIADAFLIGRGFIGGDRVALALGDNIFNGAGLDGLLEDAASSGAGATVFACRVKDPWRFGVAEFGDGMDVVSLEEKPSAPRSDYAVTGLYMYGPDVCDVASSLPPSARGELEITDVNKVYLERGELSARIIGEGVDWMDAGTFESLLEASEYVKARSAEGSDGLLCPELIALGKGYVTREEMAGWLDGKPSNAYFDRIRKAVQELRRPVGARPCRRTRSRGGSTEA